MPTCPNGHQSGSDDWCEVCGHRMAGAVPPPPPPPPPAPGGYGFPSPPPAPGGPGAPHLSGVPDRQPELCPQCRTPREGGAPFCEECRWNFLTNTATSYTPAAPRPPAGGQGAPYQRPPAGPSFGGTDSFDYRDSRPSQMNRPAEPIPPYGADPSRPVPPPPGPTPGMPGMGPGGPGVPGAPQAFQQPAPPPPAPGFPQGPATGGDDDWVLSPPSAGAPGGPGGHGGPGMPGPGGHGAPGMPGGYGYPQPGGPGQGAPPAPPRPATWTATIGPDREYFMAMMHRSGPEAAGLNLPAYSPEQQRTLTGNQVTIGRRRHSTGETPDIDLSVPPEDPGVSHQHAVLVQQPDGNWAIVDQNSTNGTTVNGSEEPIQPFVPIPLQDGDRVHVGAWTTITVRRG
ncbi:FHA domain-containing protein [Streptomyces sp. NPDC005017]|uniref:FHA domain-containing protein n=1 Tax=Streptomyces sp. NPDC005017 TaxID=3364706 RepID=UPI00369E3C43